MRTLASILLLGAAVAATACAGSGASDSSYPTTGGASADAGAGGVSFGGAQDFGDFKEILANGGVPGPDTLDANGFFNEHYVPPPKTDCTNTLCLTPGLSVGRDWITGGHQATLQIAVNTNVDPANFPRKPLDLVVVVDRSGSMASDGRIDKVRLGLTQMIDNLQDGDRMAVVSFSDATTVDAPLATLDRTALHATVDALVPGGGTNIYDGLDKGFAVLAQSTAERQRRVIFLSDGQATVGDTNQDDIISLSDRYIETGIGLTTIGVGADFDLALMRGLAEHGAGNFYFLQDTSSATEVFTEELDFFSSPIALDIQIAATAGSGYQFGDVIGSTLWSSTTTTGSMHVPAVFVASRTSQTDPTGMDHRRGGGSMLFIHLDPTGHNDAAGTVANVTITYKLPTGGDPVTQTVTLAYPNDPTVTPDDPYLSAPEMAKRYAMYNMFLGFRTATQQGDINCASVALYSTEAAAKTWNAPHEDSDIIDDIALIETYLANLRTVGATATAETDPTTCATLGDGLYPQDPPYGDQPGYGVDQPAYGCYDAGGGHASGLLAVALAGLVAVRRRRRE